MDKKATDDRMEKEDTMTEELLAEMMLGGDASRDTSKDKGKCAGGRGDDSKGKGVATVKLTYDNASPTVDKSLPDGKVPGNFCQ